MQLLEVIPTQIPSWDYRRLCSDHGSDRLRRRGDSERPQGNPIYFVLHDVARDETGDLCHRSWQSLSRIRQADLSITGYSIIRRLNTTTARATVTTVYPSIQ